MYHKLDALRASLFKDCREEISSGGWERIPDRTAPGHEYTVLALVIFSVYRTCAGHCLIRCGGHNETAFRRTRIQCLQPCPDRTGLCPYILAQGDDDLECSYGSFFCHGCQDDGNPSR